jgi:hypothetical protein
MRSREEAPAVSASAPAREVFAVLRGMLCCFSLASLRAY